MKVVTGNDRLSTTPLCYLRSLFVSYLDIIKKVDLLKFLRDWDSQPLTISSKSNHKRIHKNVPAELISGIWWCVVHQMFLDVMVKCPTIIFYLYPVKKGHYSWVFPWRIWKKLPKRLQPLVDLVLRRRRGNRSSKWCSDWVLPEGKEHHYEGPKLYIGNTCFLEVTIFQRDDNMWMLKFWMPSFRCFHTDAVIHCLQWCNVLIWTQVVD